MNVLFSSVGRRVELIRGFHNAYKQLGIKGNIIAIDSDPLAPALQIANSFFVVPRLTSPKYLKTLAYICRHENVGLIFPLIDPDIPILAANRNTLEATGARVMVVCVFRTIPAGHSDGSRPPIPTQSGH